jgi:hypothetical protein
MVRFIVLSSIVATISGNVFVFQLILASISSLEDAKAGRFQTTDIFMSDSLGLLGYVPLIVFGIALAAFYLSGIVELAKDLWGILIVKK